ncbi:MAG: TROVE domain-containing protein [Pseudonocardiaceae bacterium]
MDALAGISTRRTPQMEQADPRQILNSAGGYGFRIEDDARVHRFLVLGVDGGTYYTSERDLAKSNAEVVLRAARDRGSWLVDRIVEISTAGRAPRQNPAIFALAAAAGLADDDGRRAALAALPAVCRTGFHLFLFARYVEQLRGWGRGLRRAVAGWYTDRRPDALAYQVCKYRQREGWSHRDLLRLSHPVISSDGPDDVARQVVFDWVTHPVTPGAGVIGAVFREELDNGPELFHAFMSAQWSTSVADWVKLIERYPMSWEMLPDAALSEPDVWRALIRRGMPQTALIRQLPRLTRLGVLTGSTGQTVANQLADSERLRFARVHPMAVLIALRTYASGRGARGQSTWTPDRRIVDALDAAFYASFGAITPTGKRTLIALDVSDSMNWGQISGLPMTPRAASAALALVTMASEPDCDVVAFTSRTGRGWALRSDSAITELSISPRQRLDDVIRVVSDLPWGGTDCALPMVWAERNHREHDTFVVITDNETWHGHIHPHQALRGYRERVVPSARLAVVGMTATNVSIADPGDPGSLDVAGFDSAVPNLLADFSRGSI